MTYVHQTIAKQLHCHSLDGNDTLQNYFAIHYKLKKTLESDLT